MHCVSADRVRHDFLRPLCPGCGLSGSPKAARSLTHLTTHVIEGKLAAPLLRSGVPTQRFVPHIQPRIRGFAILRSLASPRYSRNGQYVPVLSEACKDEIPNTLMTARIPIHPRAWRTTAPRYRKPLHGSALRADRPGPYRAALCTLLRMLSRIEALQPLA